MTIEALYNLESDLEDYLEKRESDHATGLLEEVKGMIDSVIREHIL